MKIHHLEFPKLGLGLSGGEKCMLELIQFLQSQKIENILYTTDNGKATYEKLGLVENEHLSYRTIDSYQNELKYGILVSYFLRTLKAARLVKNVRTAPGDVLLCHSDFYPNSIPFHRLCANNPDAKKVAFFHMLSPSIWRGYEGQFTGKWRLPQPRIINYKLNQWLHKALAPAGGTIITVAPYYRDHLLKNYPQSKIFVLDHFGGDTVKHIDLPKKHDLVWMGRFHHQKGLLDALNVVHLIKAAKPDISLVVIGDGDPGIKQAFQNEIRALNLENNVRYAGEIIDTEAKFNTLRQSRLFLMSSVYESFGLVNLEAMKCGVPVVAFDLPVYSVFQKGMIKVPILDHQKMAGQIISLLGDPTKLLQLSQEAEHFAQAFTWQRTGEEILQILKSESDCQKSLLQK